MKPHWQVHRQRTPRHDGQQRWDRAYQLLLQWGNPNPLEAQATDQSQEKHNEQARCPVCTGFNAQSKSNADD